MNQEQHRQWDKIIDKKIDGVTEGFLKLANYNEMNTAALSAIAISLTKISGELEAIRKLGL